MGSAKEHIARAERKMDDFKHIKVNVACHKAENPTYRIYIDNDMITERVFRWPGFKNYIRENLVCVLQPGVHSLRVENCSQAGYFDLSEFEMNGDPGCMIATQPDASGHGRIITFQV